MVFYSVLHPLGSGLKTAIIASLSSSKMYLTLISRALEKNLQLLFKTIFVFPSLFCNFFFKVNKLPLVSA